MASLALAAWLLGAGGAKAFELERVDGNPCNVGNQNIFWSPGGTAFSVEALDDVDGPRAREEAQAWNDATPFLFSEKPQAAACDGADGVVSMGFSDHLCDGSTFGADVLAVTTYRFIRASGEFLSAEITFNSDATLLSDDATFRHVALHELGHVTGLAHSDSCGQSGDDSVMKAVLRRSDPRLRMPGADDVAGVDLVYGDHTPTPSPTPTPTGPTPTARASDGGCALDAVSAGERSGALLSALAAAVLLLFRHRSQSICPGTPTARRARR